MNILVTGGSGFIGSNFVRLALEKLPESNIFNLDKLTYAGNPKNLANLENDSRYRFVQGDICDATLVNKVFTDHQIDTVIHFAAESHVDRSITGPAEFINTNIIGTFTLLEAARKHWKAVTSDESQVTGSDSHIAANLKHATVPTNVSAPNLKPVTRNCFLHVSTDEVYGSLGATGLFTETTAYDPRSPYSASKASSDHLVSAYYHTYGLPVLITNCSNNYGPYQFPEKLIPLIISNALEGKELPVYGDGKNVRDWLYVEDHCTAILNVLQSGRLGETYNIGGNSEKQNIQVVETICDLLDHKVDPLPSSEPRRSLIRFVKDRPGHDQRYAIDATKIRNELGWEPSRTLDNGINQTIDWYLNNAEWVAAVKDGSYREYYQRQYGD